MYEGGVRCKARSYVETDYGWTALPLQIAVRGYRKKLRVWYAGTGAASVISNAVRNLAPQFKSTPFLQRRVTKEKGYIGV